MSSQIPWDMVKAETVRAILRDLGLKYTGRRDDMVGHLQAIERYGLDAVVEKLGGTPSSSVSKSVKAMGKEKEQPRMYVSLPTRPSARRPDTPESEEDTPLPTAPREQKRPIFEGVVLVSRTKNYSGTNALRRTTGKRKHDDEAVNGREARGMGSRSKSSNRARRGRPAHLK